MRDDEKLLDATVVANLPPIVVVDDDESSLKLTGLYLKAAGLRNPVEFAGSGNEAVAMLQRLLETGILPALLLLDVNMPDGSGLEVLEWKRTAGALEQVPVVMLTGTAEGDEVQEAYRLGATSYLVKPVGFEALADVLRSVQTPWAILPNTDA